MNYVSIEFFVFYKQEPHTMIKEYIALVSKEYAHSNRVHNIVSSTVLTECITTMFTTEVTRVTTASMTKQTPI